MRITPSNTEPGGPWAVIFDMDGTMVDNRAYHEAAWIELERRNHLLPGISRRWPILTGDGKAGSRHDGNRQLAGLFLNPQKSRCRIHGWGFIADTAFVEY